MARPAKNSFDSNDSGKDRVLLMLSKSKEEMTKTLAMVRGHLDLVQDQVSALESKQNQIIDEVVAAQMEAIKSTMSENVADLRLSDRGISESSSKKIAIAGNAPNGSSGRFAGIAKDSELQVIRERLRDYNERTSRIVGGRLHMSCENGLSLTCLVNSPIFDAVAAFLILFNSIVVGWDTEWSTRSLEVNPIIEALSSFCNWIFLIELLLRIAAFRLDFFCNAERRTWNFFDSILVVVGLMDEFSEAGAGTVGSVKMLKMIRILRIFRVFRFFRPLARLALMIMDSIRSLLWAMFMLALITYVFGVSLTSQASTWLLEQVDTSRADWYSLIENNSDITVRLVNDYYGSLLSTLYTLAQTVLAGVSWHEVMEPLLVVGIFPAGLQLLYIAFTLLAVLNVITGVFVDNAFRSADKQQTDIIQKEVDKKEECLNLIRGFFDAVDIRKEGMIRLEDLAWFLDDATMDAFFTVLGFNLYDKHRFTELLDLDGTGTVSFEEFVEGCMRYRGVAQGIDMHIVLRDTSRMQRSVQKLQEDMRCLMAGTSQDSEVRVPKKMVGL